MPRIRTVKPEFWGDEKLSPLAPIDRLVFLGLISMADDAGRVPGSLKAIDGFIFPETEDTAGPSLDVLATSGRIERGTTASGQRVIQIINWKHQKIDKPNFASALPPIVKPNTSTDLATPPVPIADDSSTPPRHVPEPSTPHSNDLRPTISDQREAVDKSTGTPNGKAGIEPNPLQAALGVLMPMIRTRFYAPDGRPPADYDDGRDAGIVLTLLRLGIGESELRDAIEGTALLRDDGQLEEWTPPVRRGDKLTMRVLYHTKRGVLPMLTEATNYLDGKRKFSSAPARGHRKPAPINTLMAVAGSR